MGRREDFQELGVFREITFSTYRKAHILRETICARIVCDALFQAKVSIGFRLYAFAVMSNHVHMLISVEGEPISLARILTSLKTSLGKRIANELRTSASPLLRDIQTISEGKFVCRIWMPGGGYDRSLHNSEAIWNSMDYIHNNPVKAGLVAITSEYEFSSARLVELGDYSVIDPLPHLFKH